VGASPEQLEAEIEATRAELGQTIDAIGAKVDAMKQAVRPQSLVRRREVQIGLGALAGIVVLKVLLARRRRG
jgi:hypothetical protein